MIWLPQSIQKTAGVKTLKVTSWGDHGKHSLNPKVTACLNSKPSWTSLPCSYLHGHRIPISDFSFQWDIICHVTKLLARFEGWLWIVINTELKTSTGSTPMDGNQLNQEGPTQCWHGPFKKCTMLFLFLLNVTTSHMLWLIYIYLFTSKGHQSPENEKYWCSNLPKPFGDCCKEPYHGPTLGQLFKWKFCGSDLCRHRELTELHTFYKDNIL